MAVGIVLFTVTAGLTPLPSMTPPAASAAPLFQLPFPCDETWRGATYSRHASAYADGYYSVDLNHDRGDGWEVGRPVLASAPGRVIVSAFQSGGYGNYVVVDHGGGWRTVYAHLNSRTVGNGAWVGQGAQLGGVGRTGAVSGAHLHFEEVYNGRVQPATFNGVRFPYTTTYNGNPVTSRNACGGGSEVVVVDEPVLFGPHGYYTRFNGVGHDGDMVRTYAEGDGRAVVNSWEWNSPVTIAGGRYRVSAFVPRAHATCVVRYYVRSNVGQTTHLVNQAPVYDAWVDLGDFNISAGRPTMGANDSTGQRGCEIGIDAIRWMRVG